MTLLLPSGQTFLSSLVSLSPPRTRHIPGEDVVQRLNYQTGRTLTETALEQEQLWVEQRLGIAGRRLSSGVVDGLGLTVADQAEAPGAFEIGRGTGLAASGQDVSLLRRAQLLTTQLREVGATEADVTPPTGLIAVVLRPGSVEIENLPVDETGVPLPSGGGRRSFDSPCPPDRDAVPFLDFVRQDAARVAFVPLDPALMGPDPARAPNMVSHALRQIERDDPAAAFWTQDGVPVAVMFLDGAGAIVWARSTAVVRTGGLLPTPTRTRHNRLFHAALTSLVEETGAAGPGWDGSNIAGFMRFLPASGILPKKCWTQPGCFPDSWSVAHAPIPMSQLDAALEAATHLSPYDLDLTGERVKILVPVPDALYAADLLEPFTAPDYDAALQTLRRRVGTERALRNAYRDQAQSVQGALDLAIVSDFTQADENAIPGEPGFAADAPTPDRYDQDSRAILSDLHDGLSTTLFTDAQRALIDPERLDGALVPGDDSFGAKPFVETMRAALDLANDTVDLSFNRVQAEIYRLRQIMLDNEEATKLATFPALAGLAKGSNAFALSQGLKQHFLAQADAPAPPPPPPPADSGGTFFTGIGTVGLLNLDLFGGLINTDAAPALSVGGLADSGTASVTLNDPNVIEGFTFDSGVTTNTDAVLNSTFLTTRTDATSSFVLGANFTELAGVSGASTTLVKDIVDNTRASLVDDAILSDAKSKRTGILRATPLPGDIRDVRNATIAERLRSSSSVDAKASAVRIKADVIRAIQDLEISIAGLTAPLTSSRDRVLLPRDQITATLAAVLSPDELSSTTITNGLAGLRSPVTDISENWDIMRLPEPEAGQEGTAINRAIAKVKASLLSAKAPITMSLLPALALSKQLDPDPGRGAGTDQADDESAFLNSAIATLEGAIGFLRLVEARVLAITGVVDGVAAQTKRLTSIAASWGTTLGQADQELDEARHDLRVAQSLADQETQERLARQAEKDRILETEVKFVAYMRPRVLPHHSSATRLGLRLPGKTADPLPAALARDVTLPKPLDQMIETLREMPIGWFTINPELAEPFKKPDYLDHVLGGMQHRAAGTRSFKATQQVAATAFGPSTSHVQISQITKAYTGLTAALVQTRTGFNATVLKPLPWKEKRDVALTMVSINDLTSAGREPAVIRAANQEVEHIERVLSALWQAARDIPQRVRLLWATQLSAFDTVTSLQSLAQLPGWSTIDFTLRSTLERLNGWLFSRMEAKPAEARALMTDIVRVALLLASQAPVADIIAAALDEADTVRPGGLITIRVRRGQPQIGNRVSFAQGAAIQAQGRVIDLIGTKAQVQIDMTAQPMVHLTQSQSVTVYHAPAIGIRAI